jgi:hypothetical protein
LWTETVEVVHRFGQRWRTETGYRCTETVEVSAPTSDTLNLNGVPKVRDERAASRVALDSDNSRPFKPPQSPLDLPTCQARAFKGLGRELDGVATLIFEDEPIDLDQKYPSGSADLPEEVPSALMRESGERPF